MDKLEFAIVIHRYFFLVTCIVDMRICDFIDIDRTKLEKKTFAVVFNASLSPIVSFIESIMLFEIPLLLDV